MEEREHLSEIFGILATYLFIVGNAYFPAKVIAKRFKPWSKEVIQFFKKYLKMHVIVNLIALLFVALHGHYAEENNIFLHLTMVSTLLLAIAGILMYHRYPIGINRRLRLLHTQQLIFASWLFFIIIGHFLL